MIPSGRARVFRAVGLCLLCLPAALAARPSYDDLTRLLPALWKKKYPIVAERFIPNPEGRGVLAAIHDGRQVFYYHYHAILPRPRRGQGESLEVVGSRKIEVWVRYRPGLGDPYDFTFARRDRLPGVSQTWVR